MGGSKRQHRLGQAFKKPESVQVRGTGDWSSGSKLAAIGNGLWKDNYFKKFNCSYVPNRTSLICNGYFVRFRVCDYFIRKLISSLSLPVQIVALGGGMDTLFFRLQEGYKDRIMSFFDVDFPSVAERKLEILRGDPELMALTTGRLFLVPGDLRCMDGIFCSLKSQGYRQELPTIFYSECVVNYLSPVESDNILRWISANVPLAVYFAYEQANPYDSFGRIMVDHFSKNGCPILSVSPNGSLALQYKQLQQHFKFCCVINAWDAFLTISENDNFPVPKVPQLQFDEYEALIATCLHYSVRIATTTEMPTHSHSPLINEIQAYFSLKSTLRSSRAVLVVDNRNVFHASSMLKIKGNSSVSTGSKIYIFGGSNHTSRLQPFIREIACSLEENGFSVSDRIVLENDLLNRNYARATCSASTSEFLIHGGRKSPFSPRDSEVLCIPFNTERLSESLVVFSKASIAPSPRWRHAITLFYRENGDPAVFLFGGKTLEVTMNDSWIWEPATNDWTALPIPTPRATEYPSPRHSHAMCTSSGRNSVFLVGGISSNDTALCSDALWEYHCLTNEWTKWTKYDAICRKVGHAVLDHGNQLFIIGGYGNDCDTSLETFITTINFETEAVQIFEFKLKPPHLFLPFDFSAHVIRPEGTQDEYLAVLGGGGNCFSFGSHYNTDSFFFRLPIN